MPWVTRYHRYDGQGNTRLLTDETGTVTDSFTYDAWGNEVARTGTTKTPFRWNGRVGYYWDEDAGTYQVRRRPYSPKRGRWLTVDPIWPRDGMNWYSFVHNNSLNRIDPSGSASLSLNPTSPDGMKWYDYNLGGGMYGQTHTEFSLVCRCFCQRGRIFRRRIRYHIKCKINANFFILINKKLIRDYLKHPGYEEIRKQDEERNVSPPTLVGTYGHEQRHVLSESALLKKMTLRLTGDENRLSYQLRSFSLCLQRASHLENKYLREYVKIVIGESHRQEVNWPQNPYPSPDDKKNYEPIGQMPADSSQLPQGITPGLSDKLEAIWNELLDLHPPSSPLTPPEVQGGEDFFTP